MAKKKKSVKLHISTKVKLIILILIVLVVLFTLDFSIKINYTIRDDLQIDLDPVQTIKSSFLYETTPVDFVVGNKNFAACNTKCKVVLTDKSNNQMLFEQEFKLTSNSNKNLSFTLPENNRIGQKIFLLEATCQNVKTTICQTANETKYRSALITVNYGFSPEQFLSVAQLEKELLRKAENLNVAENHEQLIVQQINEIKNSINTSLELVNETKNYSVVMDLAMVDFENQEFEAVELKLVTIPELNRTKTINSIKSDINIYNEKITEINSINYSELNNAYEFYVKINRTADLMASHSLLFFDSFEELVRTNVDLETLQNVVNGYAKKQLNFEKQLNKSIMNYLIIYNISVDENKSLCYNLNLTNISSNYCDELNITLLEAPDYAIIDFVSEVLLENISIPKIKEFCCVDDECYECVDKAVNYPVIFVHGHSFNKKDPAETSISRFADIQKKLDVENIYINGGDIDYQTEDQGLWSRMTQPISVRGTYYYLPYIEQDKIIKIVRKEEGIDTYAIRLKELIDLTLKNTNSDKVIIVAHSMGGLVSRNYLMLFGEDKVDKLIMIGTPNHGVSGRVEDLCGVLGDKIACSQMSEEGIFLKKLNSYKPKLRVYNIIGTGCDMSGKDGDGVVKSDSAMLTYAHNIYFEGVCKDAFETELHSDLINPEKYPLVYEMIKELLSE
ncbi:MAG: alpha/beta fold hydrolase [archaeon]